MERTIEARFVRLATSMGWLAVKMDPTNAKGLPDRLVLLPGGRAVFVEFKAPNGRLSPQQTRTLETLRRKGFPSIVASCPEAALAFCREFLPRSVV